MRSSHLKQVVWRSVTKNLCSSCDPVNKNYLDWELAGLLQSFLSKNNQFYRQQHVKIDATIEVKKDCTLLLLGRTKLETLLDTQHHRIVYYVMRGLVRHMHSLARHKSAEAKEMSNYFYRLNALY